MVEVIVTFLGAVISIVLLISQSIIDNDSIEWYTVISFLVPIVIFILKYLTNIKLFSQVIFYTILGKKIRVSMSYIYRIKINSKYLLVKNKHNGKFQFIGGKYKYYESAESDLRKLNMKHDDKLPYSKLAEKDIAFFIPASKFFKFIKWFDSRNDREIDYYREFSEEILEDKKYKIPEFDTSKFSKIKVRKVKDINTGIRKSMIESDFNCIEYVQYEIIEPIFSDEQNNELRKIQENGDTEYVKWATEKEIQNLKHINECGECEYNINIHTKWCVNENCSKRG